MKTASIAMLLLVNAACMQRGVASDGASGQHAASTQPPIATRSQRVLEEWPKTISSSSGPFRAGGDVTAPELIERVNPAYPERSGTYTLGVVILECVIGTDGRVRSVRVLKGPGNEFEQAIVVAISQWRFKPGTLHGRPVEIFHTLIVNHVPYAPGG
jgi:TonB family protein